MAARNLLDWRAIETEPQKKDQSEIGATQVYSAAASAAGA